MALPVLSQQNMSDVWVYLLGETLGAAAAAGVYLLWAIDNTASTNPNGHLSANADEEHTEEIVVENKKPFLDRDSIF